MMSAQEKRREALEIKPKLSLALKLQVTKQDLANRPHYQEVAEVFEEMLQAACKGLTHLPPRVNRLPGQLQNEARRLRDQQQREYEEFENAKERQRKDRHESIKKTLKDSKFGGREMPMGEFQKLKTKVELEEKERADRADRQAFQ